MQYCTVHIELHTTHTTPPFACSSSPPCSLSLFPGCVVSPLVHGRVRLARAERARLWIIRALLLSLHSLARTREVASAGAKSSKASLASWRTERGIAGATGNILRANGCQEE